jgi:SAM-dependent methyltransferase
MPAMPTMPSLTHGLRAARRRVNSLRARGGAPEPPEPLRHDTWLRLFDDDLGPIEAACAHGGRERFRLFRDLDADLWALLLTGGYDAYPNIRALLPRAPEPSFQELWNGNSGLALAAQSRAFYSKLLERYTTHGPLPLAKSRVLDFGCGWGRLTRYLARDVEPGRLFGCDPVEGILQVCRDNGVPATLARSEFLPDRLPFDEEFELAFSFSVFTHISEPAHERCLHALHRSLRPGALLVLTIRPPAYLWHSALMRSALEALEPDPAARLSEPRYLFVPHPAESGHLQYQGGEMSYGETVVTLPYARERWAPLFELIDASLLVGDLHQLVLTLRRR